MPTCPNCGFEVREGAKFCDNCGTNLAQQAISQQGKQQLQEQEEYKSRSQDSVYLTKKDIAKYGIAIGIFLSFVSLFLPWLSVGAFSVNILDIAEDIPGRVSILIIGLILTSSTSIFLYEEFLHPKLWAYLGVPGYFLTIGAWFSMLIEIPSDQLSTISIGFILFVVGLFIMFSCQGMTYRYLKGQPLYKDLKD